MADTDSPTLPALPDKRRSWRFRHYAVRTLIVVVLLALAAWLPVGRNVEKYRVRVGDIARERIVAPFAFRVQKDEATLRREQQAAAASVPPRYVADARIASETLSRFATFQEQALRIALDPNLNAADRAARLGGFGVPLSNDAAEGLAQPALARKVLREVGASLNELFTAGVVSEKRAGLLQGHRTVNLAEGESESPRAVSLLYDRREALDFLQRRAEAAFPGTPRSQTLMLEIASPFVQANVTYDQAETEFRRVTAQGVVPTMVGFVAKDELIVDANQRMDAATVLKLRSLRDVELARRNRSEFLYPPLARMLLMLLFIAAFTSYLRMELPAVARDNAMLAMFALLTAVTMAVAQVMVNTLGLSEFTVPIALAPLVVASLIEKRPALVFTLLLAVAVTTILEIRTPFVPVAVMGGVTAVYSVARLRHRWHFLRANLTIALANLTAILAWDLARLTPIEMLAKDATWGLLNSFLATSLAFLLLPVAEHLFGLTSDITLLELSDLNRPILKKMQLEAHGTYHHSMIVGSLVEAAAEAIGANGLLARVQAYYHDIGKLSKPEYYAENESPALRSRHERLAPSMSTLIVKSHISDGLDMAKRERLPRAVRDAIPEHHGTMVMAFFYHKALELDSNARREDYCYPGPKPRSRETAILMLADGVEGASRALADPTPSRIRGLVTRIIDERVQEGQLEQSGLTLTELARIREAFIPVLTARFHVRAPYPEDPRRRAKHEADLRREST